MTRTFSDTPGGKEDKDDQEDRNGSVEKRTGLYIVLVITAASLFVALAYIAIGASQERQPVEGALPDRIVITKTVRSIQDPAPGHETHQVAMFLPPLDEYAIYSGTLTWAASGPVELFTYHNYDGPENNSPPLYTEPSNGRTYASPLFLALPHSADHGSMNLAANAIGFHNLDGAVFTVTATFDGMTKKVAMENFQGNPMEEEDPMPGSAQATQSSNESATIIPETTLTQQDMNYVVIEEEQLRDLLDTELAGWIVTDNGTKLHKDFQFKNFVEAFQFMYNVGIEAEKMNHHPDWTNNYNTVSVYLYTWSVGDRVTDHDIRLAEIMDQYAASNDSNHS